MATAVVTALGLIAVVVLASGWPPVRAAVRRQRDLWQRYLDELQRWP